MQTETCNTRGRPYLVAQSSSHKIALVFQPSCKMWSCPTCAQSNRAKWTMRIYHGAELLINRGKTISFVTLTLPGHLDAPGTLARWRRAWPSLSARWRRASGENRDYCYVHEQHKDGRLHVHMLTTSELPQRWYKNNAAETGFGYMVDVQPVDNPLIPASYVSKYLGKGLAGMIYAWPRGWRRIGTNRGWWREEPQDYSYEWSIRPLPHHQEALQTLYAGLRRAGYEIVHTDHKSAWAVVNAVLDLAEIPDPVAI
jgi:hypothetical protein